MAHSLFILTVRRFGGSTPRGSNVFFPCFFLGGGGSYEQVPAMKISGATILGLAKFSEFIIAAQTFSSLWIAKCGLELTISIELTLSGVITLFSQIWKALERSKL